MKTLFGFVALLLSSNSLACECVQSSLSDRYMNQDLIFVGRVVEKTDLCNRQAHQEREREHYVSLCVGGPSVMLVEPTEVLKNAGNQLGKREGGFSRVFIVQEGSNCSWPMEVGKSYLIFADAATWDMYSTNQCKGTTDADRAVATIEKLKKLRAAFDELEKP